MSQSQMMSVAQSHYDESYFAWQNALGRVGGSLNAEKFLQYVKAGDSVLDFGGGGGWLLASLPGTQKLGVEINPSAREFAKKLGIDTVEHVDVAEDEAFDVVISNHALEHVEAPLDVLRKILKKLKPGGLAVFVVPCERYDTAYFPENIDQHLYTWSPRNLGNLFRRAGFEIVSVERLAHRWPPRVDFIDRFLGRRVCNALCVIYALLRPGLTQVRIVARAPMS